MKPVLFPCRAVLTLLALILLGLFAAASAQNRIAFVNPGGQLVTVSPDGADPRVLTPPGRSYQFPAWSPTNNRLAAIGIGSEGGGVFTLQDRAGAEPTRLYQDQIASPIYLYWAPDGEKVGFLANIAGGLGLQVASTDGAQLWQLATGSPLYWQWLSGSERVLVHSGVGSRGEIAFYSAAGREGEPLAEPGLFNVPGVSAGGRYLAYAEVDGSATRVVLRGKGPNNAQLRREVRYEGLAAFSWSPAAEQLAIMSPRAAARFPYGPIHLLDAETGELTPLVEATAVAFFWSPDGRHIAYLTPFRRGGGQIAAASEAISALRVGGGGAQQVQDEPLLLELRVVEVASGRDRLLSAFSPTALFLDQFLPFFDQYALSHSLWSPNSDALVLPMLGESGPQVVVVPLTGEARAIAEGEMPFWSRR
jgi:TolB protein